MKKLLLFCYLLLPTLLAFSQPANYIIDFMEDTPIFNHVNNQTTIVTGNVLLNDASKSKAGFGYKITMTVSGGPSGSSPVKYKMQDNSKETSAMASSKIDTTGSRLLETMGGKPAIAYAILGREENNNDYTYLRDPSSKLRFTLELDNGLDLENVTYVLGDMDFAFANDRTSVVECQNDADNDNYQCRYTYIDQITVISGVGSNQYSFADASKIHQTKANVFYAKFPDVEDNKKVDSEVDGRIDGDQDNGNLIVHNPGNIGKQIIFDYNDPGYGLEYDDDPYHDFDSYNQVMSFLTGTTFTANTCANDPIVLSQTNTDIYAGETACVTITSASGDITWTPSTGVVKNGNEYCFSPTTTTTYTVRSTDPSCNYEAQFIVNIKPENCTVSLSLTEATIYNGEQTCVTVSGTTAYAVSPNTGVTQDGDNLCFTPTTSTTYTVTSTDGANCTEQVQFKIDVKEENCDVSLSLTEATIYNGEQVCVTVSGTTAYSVSPKTSVNQDGNNLCFTPTANITYTITSTDGINCQEEVQMVINVQQEKCAVALSLTEAEIYNGEQVCVTVSGTTAYEVSPKTGVSQDGNNLCFTPTANTTYTVSSTDGIDCQEEVQMVISVKEENCAVSLSLTEAEIYNGEQVCVTVSGTTAYEVSPKTGVSQDGTNLCFTPTVNTTYTVSSTDGINCQEEVQMVITVKQEKCAVALSLTEADIYSGDQTCVTVSGTTAYTVSPNTGVSQDGNNLCFSPTSTTTYTVTSTDGANCSQQAQIEVRIWNENCGVSLSEIATDIYRGQESCVTVSGATNYTVSPTTGVRKLGNLLCLSPTNTTTYTVVSADAMGCPQQAQITVTIWNESAAVPTMSQWGLILFGLLILNIGVFFIRKQERLLAA